MPQSELSARNILPILTYAQVEVLPVVPQEVTQFLPTTNLSCSRVSCHHAAEAGRELEGDDAYAIPPQTCSQDGAGAKSASLAPATANASSNFEPDATMLRTVARVIGPES